MGKIFMNNPHEYVVKPLTTLNEFMEWISSIPGDAH